MVKLTPLVRSKDVPVRMRPLAWDIVPYGDVLSTSEIFSGTSLGRNFAEWVLAFSSFTSSNYHLFSRNDILKQSVSSTSEPNPVEDLRWSFCKSNEKPLTIFEKSFILDVRLSCEYASDNCFEKFLKIPKKTLKRPQWSTFLIKLVAGLENLVTGVFQWVTDSGIRWFR